MKERIKLEDFYAEAAAIESMNEELTDANESMEWMVCVYFCSPTAECWKNEPDFPYKYLTTFEECREYDTLYTGIYERKSDGKLFMIWSTYDECCEELVEVNKKTTTIDTYQ